MMKKSLLFLFLSAFYLFIQSCSKKPSACFHTSVDEDSIHVHQLITFNALCSNNAGDYFWEFYDNDDSVEFTPNVQKVFNDTGQVKVYLLVTNRRQESSVTKTIHVNP
jgi:PKD repeat protein